MLEKLRKMLKPEVFQGRLNQDRYFEGWYYKLVDRDQRHRVALIPGISLDRKLGTSHAFIQVIDGNSAETEVFEYPLEQFAADDDELRVRIGSSTFSSSSADLDIVNDHRRIQGTLAFTGLARWPRSLLAPGVMGWYSFVPRMECYHGLVSLDHEIAGELVMGRRIDFTGGRGYIEKDWGTSFPSAYVWMQSNHFGVPGVSLMASIAKIPWLGSSFTGFLATLLLRGEVLVFATYTGARLEDLEIDDTEVRFALRDRRRRLEVRASRGDDTSKRKEGFGLLRSPVEGAMKGRIAETLTAEIEVCLTEPARLGQSRTPLFAGVGRSGGLEIEARTVDLAR